ncbi:MAG TPA: 4-(cytidine 5'-diphospho)-2-C-methyl-D-erythritol kinase [Ktedonobacterales bacterium]|jgi:4-diphosphocytidyl-2-C-methyl-D-erythritol kinase|nr:4-(cytidine 5'-diphospho)-2-C-methyl-D-erythritol kinase [Ktedonobacterales bacterium]
MSAPAVFATAYAKINLTLDVLGKREDGYHELASVMQTIALHDTLLLRPSARNEIGCYCDMPDLSGPDNLALRAAQLLKAEPGAAGRGVAIELRKGIPTQAGLGGGSSDAACVLNALNGLWDLDLDVAALEAFGARLGSDVPFCIRGGTALMAGRGERVTPLPPAEPFWIVLVKPPLPVPTAEVFHRLTPDRYTGGAATAAVAAAIRAREPLPLGVLANALEATVLAAYPAIAQAFDALRSAGAPVVRMSGSGPTLYAPFRALAEALRVHAALCDSGMSAWLTHTVSSPMEGATWPPYGSARPPGLPDR